MIDVRIPKSRLRDCIERMCDDYCRWPTQLESQEQLDRFCAECPLNNIDYDEFWERSEDNGN